jgi:hypothetical protein
MSATKMANKQYSMMEVGAVMVPTGVNAIPNGSFRTVAIAATLVIVHHNLLYLFHGYSMKDGASFFSPDNDGTDFIRSVSDDAARTLLNTGV